MVYVVLKAVLLVQQSEVTRQKARLTARHALEVAVLVLVSLELFVLVMLGLWQQDFFATSDEKEVERHGYKELLRKILLAIILCTLCTSFFLVVFM